MKLPGRVWYAGFHTGVNMSRYLVESLKQRFDLHSFKVYFDINDSVHAEEILDFLDRARPGIKSTFCLTEDPPIEVFIYPDLKTVERVTQKPVAMGETSRIVAEDNAILLSSQHITPRIGEKVVQLFCYQVFNKLVKEKAEDIRRWRSPAWLREGVCLQVPYRLKPHSKDFLLHGWNQLQDCQKNNTLIKPNMLVNNLGLIPDEQRRTLAYFESFYMVRLLTTQYSTGFFNKYATLMSALDHMEAETIFRQITSFDFDKFFSLFEDWVRTTNGWAAME